MKKGYKAINLTLMFLCCLFLLLGCKSKKTAEKKFEGYRVAIQEQYGIDIQGRKEQLMGGEADNTDITKYDLNQILLGIKVESEHTTDKYLALEITMDHLEEIPDYYDRLLKMEEEYEEEVEDKD